MKKHKDTLKLTEKESEIMSMLWETGGMFVREMLERYPEPKPHVNTVSTTVRILEEKGYVEHSGGQFIPLPCAAAGLSLCRQILCTDDKDIFHGVGKRSRVCVGRTGTDFG